MSPIVHEVDIDRPPDQVYAYATDPTRFPTWQRDVTSARMQRGSPQEVGATFATSRRIAGIEVIQCQEVVEANPPTRWAARAVDGPIRADASVAIEPLDNGSRSRVTFTLDFEGPGIGRLMVPQVRRMAAKAAPNSYRALKELLEQRPAGSP